MPVMAGNKSRKKRANLITNPVQIGLSKVSVENPSEPRKSNYMNPKIL